MRRDSLVSGRICCLRTSGSPQYQADCLGQALPVGLLTLHILTAVFRQRIKFGFAIIFRFAPLGGDPALLLESMQRGIKRALIYLQDFFGDLADALGDSPSVGGLENNCFKYKKVQGALDEIGGLTHAAEAPLS